MALAPLSAGFQSLLPATNNQIGPFWCCFPSGWVCARSRPLCISPTTSPKRLGVSPAAASTPTGVFSQWFEALFPHAGTLGFAVCRLVHQLLLTNQLQLSPPHNPPPSWVRQLPPCRESSPPGYLSPPLLPVWVNVSSLSPWYSSIFCQFWLFFFFKLLSFFWLCKEALCVYLRLCLGQK